MPGHEAIRALPESRADHGAGGSTSAGRAVRTDRSPVNRAFHLLAALSVGAFLLVAPTPAQAQCQGLNNPYNTGTTWGREGANVNTCDYDGWYYGWVQDIKEDGYCVEYQWKDDWTSSGWNLAAYGCNYYVKVYFHYSTADHDSAFRICKQSGSCATAGLNWDF